MAEKTILIIGAGIAGLSAGCYGQMNGYRTKIFELHTQPGGLCTAWSRKGYTFDGCIHWLMGSSDGPYHRVWEELGALHGQAIVNHDEYLRLYSSGGRTFNLYTDADRLEKHMLDLAPADAKPIKEFTNTIRHMARYDMPLSPAREIATPLDGLKAFAAMAPLMPAFMQWGKLPVADFAKRFSDPFLREVFNSIYGDGFERMPMVALLMMLAWMHKRNAGYPIGGSLKFAQGIEQRYRALGGELHYKARVKKILVEEGRAVGIQLADGTEHLGDVVISAADGRATIFDMLEGKYANDTVRGYYAKLPIFRSMVVVSLGVARDFSAEPQQMVQALERPVLIAGEERPTFPVKHYCFDPTLAPKGKSVVMVMLGSNHAYWKPLADDQERYESEKQQAAITVIEQLEKRYPGITNQIEVVDVATPLTFERYTGNWQGSIEGWLPTVDTMPMVMQGMRHTLPGLENFYMIGQWVEPGGGLPPAATSGRNIIQVLCHGDRKKFVTSKG